MRASASAASVGRSTSGARRRSRSAPYSITPFSIRKNAADCARGEQVAQRVLEQQAEQAGRHRADHEQPAEPGVGVVADLAVAQRAAEAREDPHPVAPEEAEQHERRGQVGGDQEGEEEVVVLVDVPAEQRGRITLWPEARDGEQLG